MTPEPGPPKLLVHPAPAPQASPAAAAGSPPRRSRVQAVLHPFGLGPLTDDVEWLIHGHRTARGKAEFDGEFENSAFTGSLELDVQRIYEDGPVVVTMGEGRGVSVDRGPWFVGFPLGANRKNRIGWP